MGGKNRHSNRGTATSRKSLNGSSLKNNIKLSHKQKNKSAKSKNRVEHEQRKERGEKRKFEDTIKPKTNPNQKLIEEKGKDQPQTRIGKDLRSNKKQKRSLPTVTQYKHHVSPDDEDTISNLARALIESETNEKEEEEGEENEQEMLANGAVFKDLKQNQFNEARINEYSYDDGGDDEEEEYMNNNDDEHDDDDLSVGGSESFLSRFENQPRRFPQNEFQRLPVHDNKGKWNDIKILEKKQKEAAKLMNKEINLVNNNSSSQKQKSELPANTYMSQLTAESKTNSLRNESKTSKSDNKMRDTRPLNGQREAVTDYEEIETSLDEADVDVDIINEGEHLDDDYENELSDFSVDSSDEKSPIEIHEQIAARVRLQRLKLEIADIAECVLEDPEKNLHKLNRLHELCSDEDINIQKLALLSEVEVLRDLIPSYRIRLPTDQEMKAKLSKETETIWKFERNFLLIYSRLVRFLLELSKATFQSSKKYHSSHSINITPLALTIVKCTSRLLENAYHFNHSKELILAVLPLLNHVNSKVRTLCLNCFIHIFKSDISGDATLEIVRHIGHLIKKKDGNVHPDLLISFLHLPLSKEIIDSTVNDDAEKKSKKNKKLNKNKKAQSHLVDEKELNRDLAEGEGIISINKKKLTQTAIITSVFSTYFHILKYNFTASTLPVVLQGLAKFSQLINIELFIDLLDVLNKLINPNSIKPLSIESSLYCIFTVFHLLNTGYGQSIEMDLSEFFNNFYSLLNKFVYTQNYRHFPLLFNCLNLLFINIKQLSVDKIIAFVRRLFILTLYIPHNAIIGILHQIKLILIKNHHTKLDLLFDNNNDITSANNYNSDIDNVELTNSISSTVWELGLLYLNTHPIINYLVHSILNNQHDSEVELLKTTPLEMYYKYQFLNQNNNNNNELFNPSLPIPSGLEMKNNINQINTINGKRKNEINRRLLLTNSALTADTTSKFIKQIKNMSESFVVEEEEEVVSHDLPNFTLSLWKEFNLLKQLRLNTILKQYKERKKKKLNKPIRS